MSIERSSLYRISKADLYRMLRLLRTVTKQDHYDLDWANGRPRLVFRTDRVVYPVSPRFLKVQLYDWISAYIRGWEAGAGIQKY